MGATLQTFTGLGNSNIQVIGPDLIFGHIYDWIGFNQNQRRYVLSFGISPFGLSLSKLKTIHYLRRYQCVTLEVSAVYVF